MRKLKCLIFDSDLKSTKQIQSLLNVHFENIEVVKLLSNKPLSSAIIQAQKPDFVFLDVNVDDSGVLGKKDSLDFDIIFLTRFDAHTVKAFDYSTTPYILKPIEEEQFIATIQTCCEKRLKKLNGHSAKNGHSAINPSLTKKLAIPTSDGYVIKKIDEIVRIESKNRYAVLYFMDKTKYVSSYNLGKYKDMLTNSSFIQSHKSHIVNKEHISSYHNSGYLVLSNGDQVPIASSKRKTVLQQIKNF